MGTSISWILPAQESVDRTLEALAHLRDSTRGAGAQTILVDQPGLFGLARHVADDVLVVRTERRLSLAGLLQVGLDTAENDIVIWCPVGYRIAADELDQSIDFVLRHDAIVLAARSGTVRQGSKILSSPGRGRRAVEPLPAANALRLRLCQECFVARRQTAQRVAARLRIWGDSPLKTAALLAALRLPVHFHHGLTAIEAPQSPVAGTERQAVGLSQTPRAASPRPSGEPLVSLIITAHNEGLELSRTIASIETNTRSPIEFVVVDDGSTDGSCQNLAREGIRVIRNSERVGVAFSRNAAAEVSRGDVLAFFDGHQRVSPGCLERCASVALAHDAIVWPDVRTLHNRSAIGHGASFQLQSGANPLTAKWNTRRPGDTITKISSLRAPGYFVPRKRFGELRWISQLRGWGASEAAVSLKAFFLGIDLLHVCGPVARHLFRPNFQYTVSDEQVARNHALVVRVCFDDRTWFEHWLPEVFENCLSAESIRDLHGPDVIAEHDDFLSRKRRTDREFWRGLLHREEPKSVDASPRWLVTTSTPIAKLS